MADVTIANIGLNEGGSDSLARFLKVFAGETITAFERASITNGRHIVRTIESGKSAQFPTFGRATAAYLKSGKSLDDLRQNIPGGEKIIQIDGLLTTSQLISDIDEALSHFDVRGEYSRQMGEALAQAADGAVLAEAAKMVVAGKENLAGLGKGEIIKKTLTRGITEEMGKAIVQMLLEIKAKMSQNYVPNADRYVYMLPEGVAALTMSLIAINKEYGAVATITEANVLRVAGFDIVECPHLTAGGAAKNEGVLQGDGHVFPASLAKDCMFIAMHRSAVGTVKLKDLALERARRAEYQADMLVASYAMGHGGLRPEACYIGSVSGS